MKLKGLTFGKAFFYLGWSMKDSVPDNIDRNRLLFRRQFLLSSSEFIPTEYWRSIAVGDEWFLSIHSDLPSYEFKNDRIHAILLGIAIDVNHPDLQEEEILSGLCGDNKVLQELPESTHFLGGRWACIVFHKKESIIFHDACGFRSVYYHAKTRTIGSSPQIIKEQVHLKEVDDPEIHRFYHQKSFRRKEGAWLGPGTKYEDCLRLMPNHFLKFQEMKAVRFYPHNDILSTGSYEDILLESTRIMKNSFAAFTKKMPLLQPVTSGWDTRVLLAASKNCKQSIDFFIDTFNKLNDTHEDVVIASSLSDQFDLGMVIRKPKENQFPTWFIDLLSRNNTHFFAPKNRWIIFNHLISGEERILVSGNVGEMGRSHFNKQGVYAEPNRLSASQLAEVYGYKNPPGIFLASLEDWKKSLMLLEHKNWSLLDFLYWEQKMGVWGANFRSHQDIAVDEVSPFNNRRLLELFIQVLEAKKRQPGFRFFSDLTSMLWPEVLDFPINPKKRKPWYNRAEKKVRLKIKSWTQGRS